MTARFYSSHTRPQAYDEHHENQTVRFVVEMSPEQMKLAEAEGLEKRFKIHSTLSTSNMVCFDPAGKIKKYSSAEEIVREFYPIRLEYYMKRKVCVASSSWYSSRHLHS